VKRTKFEKGDLDVSLKVITSIVVFAMIAK
jgi:hypothetical protein